MIRFQFISRNSPYFSSDAIDVITKSPIVVRTVVFDFMDVGNGSILRQTTD